MTGIPVPYNFTHDNTIMLLFMINIIGVAYVVTMNGANIIERTKCIFYYENKVTPYSDRTHVTRICNFMMYFQSTFYATITIAGILRKYSIATEGGSMLTPMLVIAAALVVFFALKGVVFYIVNNTLFSKSTSDEWNSFYFFTIKLIGFILTPAAITVLFFPSISLKCVEFFSILTIIIYLYTTISGLSRIIFTKKRTYLNLFLYLCALDFLPIAIMWKTILQLDDF